MIKLEWTSTTGFWPISVQNSHFQCSMQGLLPQLPRGGVVMVDNFLHELEVASDLEEVGSSGELLLLDD